MSAAPLLSVRDLHTQFFSPHGVVRAVDGVSFDLAEGEALGIVGESGSGKSATALSLLRLVPPPGRIVSGAIEFAGADLLTLSDDEMRRIRRAEIGMIFQDAGSYLNPVLTIGEQIAEAIGDRGFRDKRTRPAMINALKAVQIADPVRVAGSYPHELSGGMQQRSLIAAVLIRKPRLIVADEPTTALDATVQHQILKFIAELRSSLGSALILISHDLAVVAQVCDRVCIMYGGEIVEHGPTKRIFEQPRHPYTRALIDSILDPWDPKRTLNAIDGAPPDMAAPPAGCRFHPRCPAVFGPCAARTPPAVAFDAGQEARCWLHAAETVVAR